MIYVTPQPEPQDFDRKVRQKGLAWLRKEGIDLNAALPKRKELPAYWREELDELYAAYGNCCAYLAVFFERTTGEGTVDHFVPKSLRPDLAYEWNNYRLACSRMNSRKRDFSDVLDPFEVKNGWFRLEVVSGRIFPDPHLSDRLRQQVQETIDRLGLDDPDNREMRAKHYQDYCEREVTASYLRKHSPFVWMEAKRQGLLEI